MKSLSGKVEVGLLKTSENSKVLKIADLVTSTVLSNSGIPGANAAYDFAKLGIDSVRKYLVERQDAKIVEFHKAMIGGDNDGIDESILESVIDVADYHALLDACLADIEMEKNGMYGRLAKSIASGDVKKHLKRHYILSLKELTWDQIDLLARLYILTKYSIKPENGPGTQQVNQVIDSAKHGTIERLDITALTSRGFVYGSEITDLCEPFLSAVLPEENMTPEAFDLEEWTGHRFTIIELCNEQHETRDLTKVIDQYFRDMGIQGGSGPMEGALDRTDLGTFSSFFIIIYPNGKTIPDTRKDNLLRITKNKHALQVIMCATDREIPNPIAELPYVVALPEATQQTLKSVDQKLSEIMTGSKKAYHPKD